ncbi:DUF2190 family protein [Hoyosella altamirensis]|uniref:DUF2190 domain-containing protein n=1 Tax=Hoyosella altamirensis TaxID=616997 RepID=A0A839RWM1_9ACTN|nr:DUF2190 family protein [Hoyosella altamirensis]MBB3040141.1 hypothetical protein [Hoyosella altamirensis]
MSNPTFRSGPYTFAATAPVEKFSVVTLGENGVSPCAADGVPFGAVTESAAPEMPSEPNNLQHGLPTSVAVHVSGAVPLRVADDVTAKVGDVVYTAAGGAVTTDGTDATRVGVVIKTGVLGGDLVRVHLTCPESN